MVNKVTLEQAERLAAQLAPQEQIKLIACMSEWLSKMRLSEAAEDSGRQDYAAQVEAFLKMSDEMAAETNCSCFNRPIWYADFQGIEFSVGSFRTIIGECSNAYHKIFKTCSTKWKR